MVRVPTCFAALHVHIYKLRIVHVSCILRIFFVYVRLHVSLSFPSSSIALHVPSFIFDVPRALSTIGNEFQHIIRKHKHPFQFEWADFGGT